MQRPHDLRDRLRHAVLPGAGGQRYQVRELLGEGGQGWVFKASPEGADAPFVVLKVLRPDLARSDAFARFEREATVLRALSSGPAPHPHIVRFHEHGRAQVRGPEGPVDVSYLVLEYVDGPTLARVLAAHGGFGLPAARVRRVLRHVARALADMHAQSIVHRDLKPSNILLASRDAGEVAKVTDFGLVKLVDGSSTQTITVAGASAGYAPPEQYEVGNRRVGPPTDVFSFGAILFEALSGREAFPVVPGDTPLRMVARMLGDDRPALARASATIPRELRDQPEITAALDREIARATDGDPDRRHASITELWAAVEPLLRALTGGAGARISAPPEAAPGSHPQPAPSAPRASALDAHPARASAPDAHPARASAPSRPALDPGAPQPAASRLVGKPLTGERLRGAAFGQDGRSLVAAGAYGLYAFANGVWSALRTPRGVDGRGVRGLVRLPGGDLLLYGDGLAVTMTPGGRHASIDCAGGDVVWLGATAGEAGVLLAGERRSRAIGVVAILPAGAPPVVRDIEGAPRMHAAARLASGRVLACGTHGALVTIDAGGGPSSGGGVSSGGGAGSGGGGVQGDGVQQVPWGRTGHLYALAPAPGGGAHVVGSGGHALWIAPPRDPPPAATLEAVQTTRDLTAVIVDAAGTAIAAGAQGRLLVRRGGAWTRVPLAVTAESLVAIAAPARRPGEVLALAEDGAVIEVPLA